MFHKRLDFKLSTTQHHASTAPLLPVRRAPRTPRQRSSLADLLHHEKTSRLLKSRRVARASAAEFPIYFMAVGVLLSKMTKTIILPTKAARTVLARFQPKKLLLRSMICRLLFVPQKC